MPFLLTKRHVGCQPRSQGLFLFLGFQTREKALGTRLVGSGNEIVGLGARRGLGTCRHVCATPPGGTPYSGLYGETPPETPSYLGSSFLLTSGKERKLEVRD